MSDETPQKKKPMRSARNKLMDLLAQRDHSEKELRTKLRQRKFTDDEINKAISDAQDHKWMAPPQEIAEKYANALHNKNKGINYINLKMQAKGLPGIGIDSELELEKARRLVETKFSDITKLPREERARVARFLEARGFDSETIRKIIFS